jgi:hypothetical protein
MVDSMQMESGVDTKCELGFWLELKRIQASSLRSSALWSTWPEMHTGVNGLGVVLVSELEEEGVRESEREGVKEKKWEGGREGVGRSEREG